MVKDSFFHFFLILCVQYYGQTVMEVAFSFLVILQATSLLDIEMQTPSSSHLEEIGLPGNCDVVQNFQLEGFISSCAHGQGRSSTDRQFYYINNRPCDPSKVIRVKTKHHHCPFFGVCYVLLLLALILC